jgi:hypothetical protein
MRKLAMIAIALALTGCTVRSDSQNAATAKLLADAEAVALAELAPGPTRTALCIALEKASAQVGVTLHPAGSPVAVPSTLPASP